MLAISNSIAAFNNAAVSPWEWLLIDTPSCNRFNRVAAVPKYSNMKVRGLPFMRL